MNEPASDLWRCPRRTVAPSLTFPTQRAHFVSCDAEMPGVALLPLFWLCSCCFKPCNSGGVLSYGQPSQSSPVACSWLHATILVLACVVPSLQERLLITQPPFLFLFSLVIFLQENDTMLILIQNDHRHLLDKKWIQGGISQDSRAVL